MKLIHAGARQWKLLPEHKEKPNLSPSLAVPDDAYTVRELLAKFSSGGQAMPIGKIPLFMSEVNEGADLDHDMDDLEKVQQMELYDRTEIAKIHEEQLKEKRSAMDKAASKVKELRDAELKAQRDKEFEEFAKKHSPASDKSKGTDAPKV